MNKKKLFTLLMLSAALVCTPRKAAAQYFSPGLCSPPTGYERSFSDWRNGWCLSFTSNGSEQALAAGTVTSSDHLFLFRKSWMNGLLLYGVSISRDGNTLVTYTTDSSGNILNIRGNPNTIQSFMPEVQAATRIVNEFYLPMQGNPFVATRTPPSGTCEVIDGYVSIGVESPAPSEPARIRGSNPGSRVNLREGPGTEFTADAYGLVGDSVQVIGQAFSTECETWAKVRFPQSGYEGWIHANYIEMEYARGWWD